MPVKFLLNAFLAETVYILVCCDIYITGNPENSFSNPVSAVLKIVVTLLLLPHLLHYINHINCTKVDDYRHELLQECGHIHSP